MDAAERKTRAAMNAANERIADIYSQALKQAIKDQKSFLKKIADIDSGKIKPPAFYDTPEKLLKWRQGYTRELIRRENVVERIARQLNAAGVDVHPIIQSTMVDIYGENRAYTIHTIQRSGGTVSFQPVNQKQINVILQQTQTPFSKIAFKNLGNNPLVVGRLQSELTQSALLGESQRDVIKRIRKVTRQSQYQAQRVAQTESLRVMNQARYDAATEAEAMGLKMTKEWSARLVNTRETHANLDGVKVAHDEAFVTSAGNKLMYPGDPSAPADEIINCHCVLITDVEV